MNTDFNDVKLWSVRLQFTAGGIATFGSGVFVTRTTILTARHVVDPKELSLVGKEIDPEFIQIQSSAFFGARTPDRILFPDDPKIDLALVKLHPSKAVRTDNCAPVLKDTASALNCGDEVEIAGFSSVEGDIQMDQLRILAVHEKAGVFICSKAVPEGYSGGPVFANGALAGVMYARNFGQGQSYFYGGSHLRDLLEIVEKRDLLGIVENDSIKWIDGNISPLRHYPLGPGISPNETSWRSDSIQKFYVSQYRGNEARSLVAKANAARQNCGPFATVSGLINLAELSDADFDPAGFWYGAFRQAGQKSPRMLAALLEVVDAELLDAPSRKEKVALLDYLAQLGR